MGFDNYRVDNIIRVQEHSKAIETLKTWESARARSDLDAAGTDFLDRAIAGTKERIAALAEPFPLSWS